MKPPAAQGETPGLATEELHFHRATATPFSPQVSTHAKGRRTKSKEAMERGSLLMSPKSPCSCRKQQCFPGISQETRFPSSRPPRAQGLKSYPNQGHATAIASNKTWKQSLSHASRPCKGTACPWMTTTHPAPAQAANAQAQRHLLSPPSGQPGPHQPADSRLMACVLLPKQRAALVQSPGSGPASLQDAKWPRSLLPWAIYKQSITGACPSGCSWDEAAPTGLFCTEYPVKAPLHSR